MFSRAILLLPSLLLACDGGEDSVDLTDVTERLDALEAENTSQGDTIASLEAENAALQSEIDAINGAVDLTELASTVAQNNTDIAAIALDYLSSTDLNGVATEVYVDGAIADVDHSSYLTSADLSGYATESYVDSAIADVDHSSYLTSSDLSGYATESWVSGQGYSTDSVSGELTALANYLNVDATNNTIVFTGANVLIQSGSGHTDDNGTLLGLGNLIVGYDEDDGADSKTGSHNLVVGTEHSYTSFGGLIAGYDNEVSGEWASISGGKHSAASEDYSSVSGGEPPRPVGPTARPALDTATRPVGPTAPSAGGYTARQAGPRAPSAVVYTTRQAEDIARSVGASSTRPAGPAARSAGGYSTRPVGPAARSAGDHTTQPVGTTAG